MENVQSPDVYAKMQTGDPVAVYTKTILGKVEVTVINPFSGSPENVLLEGDPKKKGSKCFYEVWSPMEEVFFERQNAPLFKEGYIKKLKDNKKPKPVKEKEVKDYSKLSDEDIELMVTSPFMKFKKELNEINSEAVLYRILAKAEEIERPEKTLEHIKQRLTEIQTVEE